MDRGGNNDFSRQMSQFGRGMAEFGRLMSEWGRQMGEAGRQMSQDISRRMTEDISRRMAAEAGNVQPNNGQGQPTAGEGAPQQPGGEAGGQGMGESGQAQQPGMAELGRQLAEELGNQMGDYSRQVGDSGRRPGDSGSNVVNINVTCSINDVHTGAPTVPCSPFGLCNPCSPFSATSPCSPFTTSNPCSPFSATAPCGPGCPCVPPGVACGVLDGILSGPRNVFDLMTDARKFQDFISGARSNNCIKWVTCNEDGGRVVTKITGTGSGDCDLVMKNGVVSVAGFPIDTSIPCFTKRYDPEEKSDSEQMLVLELDTSKFKGDDVLVIPERGSVKVRIVHAENLPNGAEVQQTYDVTCPLPEGDSEKEDVISYFSDGDKLTIDVCVR